MDHRLFRNLIMISVGLVVTAMAPIFLAAQPFSDTDWPQWRGVNRDDISKETGLLQEWPEGGPQKRWTFEKAGSGYAGFAVVSDRLYTLGSTGESEFAICLDANDGSVIWQQTIDSLFVNRWGDGPRNTPTVDGENLYVLSAGGVLKCLNLKDGTEKWGVSLTEDFGGTKPYWGYAESPLVDGEKVICTPGGKEGAMIALDKETGETIWQSRLFTDLCHYSSVVAADVNGKRQYIQLVEKAVVGIDAENGDMLWREKWRGRTAVIPTPVFHDNKVYVTSGYGAGSMLLDIANSAGPKKVWSSNKMKNHHGGVILLDGHYYGYSDKVGWVCQSESTGDVVWSEKDELRKGAISYADGRFYLLEEKTGTVVLIEASSDGWSEKGRFDLQPLSSHRKPSGAIWVHPVISNGKLFLRDQEFISCFDISASE